MPYIFTVLHLKSENFGENLKIHAGGDDKLRIQFAPPYSLKTCTQEFDNIILIAARVMLYNIIINSTILISTN